MRNVLLDESIVESFQDQAKKTKEYPLDCGEMYILKKELMNLCGVTELEAHNILCNRNVGDVLYIDCRPFLQPCYCLVYYIDENRRDCCGTRCLFLTEEKLVQEGALKHGHFYPTNSDIQCPFFISPLYRAEICKEIPKELCLLDDVGHMLKQNPSMSKKLDRFFCENRETKICEEQMKKNIM